MTTQGDVPISITSHQHDFPDDLAVAHRRERFGIPLERKRRHRVRFELAGGIEIEQLMAHRAEFLGLVIAMIADLAVAGFDLGMRVPVNPTATILPHYAIAQSAVERIAADVIDNHVDTTFGNRRIHLLGRIVSKIRNPDIDDVISAARFRRRGPVGAVDRGEHGRAERLRDLYRHEPDPTAAITSAPFASRNDLAIAFTFSS